MQTERLVVFAISLIYLGFAWADNLRAEPQCSNFHYEEQLLEKMIRMEMKVEGLEKQILETNKQFLDNLGDQNRKKQELADTYKKLEETNASRYEKMKGEIDLLKAAHFGEHVAFHADLTKTITDKNQRIIFDDVKLNIGNAYNTATGMFVAPVNGTYLIYVTACSSSGNHIVLDINVKNQLIGRVLAGDDAYYDCNSKQFLARLTHGDFVAVRHESDGNVLTAHFPYGYPSFGACLLNSVNSSK